MTPAQEDKQLLVQIRSGDLAALGALRAKYRPMVFQMALAITRDHQTAEDVLQQCFMQLRAQAERLDGEQPLGPWLYQTTTDLGRARLTQPIRRWIVTENLLDRFDRLLTPSGPSGQPDVPVEFQRAIETLPEHQRVVLTLYYLGGLRLKEIAFALECPIGTVKSRLHYGRELLRRQLAREATSFVTPSLEGPYDQTPLPERLR
ncbi:MAG TPA: RNA polymerase sigma factor [Anaerolineae bacterium]|nr:RNA polymerase sigma factor [Anaerolineae bacterium]